MLKKFFLSLAAMLLTVSALAAQQQKPKPTTPPPAAPTAPVAAASEETPAKPKKPRPPIFRANKQQIEAAQNILKQRSFYTGEATGKLSDETRAGLKQFQAAEGIKVTGTLNAPTLEKMKIELTDKQKEVLAKQKAMKEGAM